MGFFNRHRTLTGCQNTLYHSDKIKCAKNEIKINKIILTSHIKYIGNVEQFYSKNKLDRTYNATKAEHIILFPEHKHSVSSLKTVKF